MTDRPYTDADLRAAAALMHYALTIAPNPADADAALSENPRWQLVEPGSDYEDQLRETTVELVSKAADISRWAVDLGADGLQPEGAFLKVTTSQGLVARIHFAFAPDTPTEARAGFMARVASIGDLVDLDD